ncbi:hypothetical protein [Streptomyces abikoensis]|uniref:Uncharacterized protein n=1 Tax=Streptomyces abikoensis TaxID=97398 RepID=A0ABW7T9Q4_9ACTN
MSPGPAPDELTLGELARRFEERLADVRDDIQQLGLRIDSKVSREVYDLRQEVLSTRVAALETLREKDAERLVATRRWMVGAVIVPLVCVILPLLIVLAHNQGS